MSDPLLCAPSPCSSCPYRRDVPSGIWDPSEYEKLACYDTELVFALFLCHAHGKASPSLCRGWLSVHSDCVAVRLGLLRGRITVAQRDAEVSVPLYGSGAEARDAGLSGVEEPGDDALRMIARLERRLAED